MGGKTNTKEITAPEILLVDKPKGVTSFGVVHQVRKALRVKKVGHAGTLDPRATGLLVLGVGVGTKKLHEYLKLPKVYEAHILLGIRTDTGDLDGVVVEKLPVPTLSSEKIQKTVKGMEGALELPVPVYSAIKRGGKPLYAYARAGKMVEVPIKTMQINEAHLVGIEGDVLHIRFAVGSGTYIRSLSEELGRRLGTVATLAELRRTSIGNFDIKNAIPLARIVL